VRGSPSLDLEPGVPTDLTKISKATEEKIDEASKVRPFPLLQLS
jgi:hypothetical protein